jgi:phospholipase C
MVRYPTVVLVGGKSMQVSRFLGVLLLCAPMVACSLGATTMNNPGPRPTPNGKIKHIVIIVQENRTVDNLFNGLKGADTVTSGLDHRGHVVPFRVIKLERTQDVCHDHTCWNVTYDGGKLDGFDLNHPPGTSPHFAYAMVDPNETVPYFAMAQAYTFADRFFQSNSGPSYPAHQYLIAGQSARVDENPVDATGYDAWGCDSPSGTTTRVLDSNGQDVPGPYPCFNYPTLADEMDGLGITWHYYAPAVGTNGGVWSAFDAVQQIRRGPDWHNDVISPETKILTDVPGGTLEDVTWVAPSKPNSDHAGDGGKTGPDWVASVVNAIGTSPYWSSTAIFVTWDDWGGWYDHVKPDQEPSGMGLGYRVPLIVISPYARTKFVSHAKHQFGSIMRFTEEVFGLPSLGLIDSQSDDLSDCFDFTQSPIPFNPIPMVHHNAQFFINQAPTLQAPDNN